MNSTDRNAIRVFCEQGEISRQRPDHSGADHQRGDDYRRRLVVAALGADRHRLMTTPPDSIAITHSQPGKRLDQVLQKQLPGCSRGELQRLIRTGDVRVDGRAVKASHHPCAGETVTIRWPAPEPADLAPEAIPLDILLEDERLLVLNARARARASETPAPRARPRVSRV